MDLGHAAEVVGQWTIQAGGWVVAGGVVWTKVVAPVVFRPVGKALARGARHEAEAVVHELVDPQIQLLTRGQHALEQRLSEVADQLGRVLDRMPPAP
jgi:hypothetical protein